MCPYLIHYTPVQQGLVFIPPWWWRCLTWNGSGLSQHHDHNCQGSRALGFWTGSMGKIREQNLYFQTSCKKGALLWGHSEQLCMETKLWALPYPNLVSFVAKRTVLPPTCPRPHLTLPQSFISSSLCMDLLKNWLDLQPLIGPDLVSGTWEALDKLTIHIHWRSLAWCCVGSPWVKADSPMWLQPGVFPPY